MRHEGEAIEEYIAREFAALALSDAVDCALHPVTFWAIARRLNAKVETGNRPVPHEFMTLHTKAGPVRLIVDHDAPLDEPTFVLAAKQDEWLLETVKDDDT